MTSRDLARVQWGPVVAGALVAIATALVLGSFGAAFALGAGETSRGMGALGAVWEILTPLVALFVGALVAVSMIGRRGAYLGGVVVWCLALAYGALLLAAFGAPGRTSQVSQALPAGGAGAALAGLALALGLVGALIGSAIGAGLARRRAGAFEQQALAGDSGQATAHRERAAVSEPAGRAASPGSQPGLHH